MSIAPPRFFVTFTSAERKWIYLVETFHELKKIHDININNTNIQHEDENILELVKGDLVTFALYNDHKMKCFHKLLQSTNTLFGQVKNYIFLTKFQAWSEYDHELLWIEGAPICAINSNDEIQSFIDKYIIGDKFL